MTLLSMTGFGAGRAECDMADGGTFVAAAEVKTVNHRHLQAKIRLPQEFSALEGKLDALVRSKLSRGSVQAAIDVTRSLGVEALARFDADVARRYVEGQAALAKDLGLKPLESIAQVLSLPGVVVAPTNAAPGPIGPDGPEARAIQAAFSNALDALLSMRRTEGAAMVSDLRTNAAAVAELVAKIETRVPGIVTHHKDKLLERVRELVDSTAVEPADLAREAALLADKLDVSEELARLKSHLEQLETLLRSGGAVGRKLDFLAQEFFREANTIGSKCSDAEVAHLVVDLKTHVERLREQVQNIE